jgi:hypothetical protein
MALTVSVPAPTANVAGVYSPANAKIALLVGDAAYALGGYVVSPSQFGFYQQLQAVNALAQAVVTGSYCPVYDPAFGRIRIYQIPAAAGTAMNEVATGTNLSAMQLTVAATGW